MLGHNAAAFSGVCTPLINFICDWAWENGSYLHVKFNLILRVQLKCNNFYLYSVLYLKCHQIHEEFNKTIYNRFWIVHTEQARR